MMTASRRGHREAHTTSQLSQRHVPVRPVRTHLRLRQTASSVWLPWLAGLLGLLSIAALTALTGGRIDGGVAVPTTVLDLQQAAVVSAAQQVRDGLEGGVRVLAQIAGSLSTAADDAAVAGQVAAFAKRYRRYTAVYVLNDSGGVVTQAGATPHAQFAPRAPRRAGITDAVGIDHVPVALEYAPFTRAGKTHLVVAEYNLARLRYALDTLRPAAAWLVNAKGEVVASTGGFVAFEHLGKGDLAKAATARSDKPEVLLSQGGVDASAIIAAAPVRDKDPTPVVPGWRLVTSRSVSTIALPQTRARDQALLVGLALTMVTIGVFGWMYVGWLRPLRRLVLDADRIADGDIRTPVQLRRHDEIGLVARALERIRSGIERDQNLRYPDHPQTVRTASREFRL